jgi:hypothetical protein
MNESNKWKDPVCSQEGKDELSVDLSIEDTGTIATRDALFSGMNGKILNLRLSIMRLL